MNNKLKSVGFFDELKGILLILVVWVHMGSHMVMRFPDDFWVGVMEVIRGRLDFVMTLFFMLAGFFFKETEMKTCVKKGLKTLIRPYFIVMLFAILGTAAYSFVLGEREEIISRFLGQSLGFLLGVNTSIFIGDFEIMRTGAAWFLLALFFGRVFLNGIFRWSKDERKRAIAVGILVIIGMCLSIFPYSVYCISQSLLATGYMYVGYMMNQADFLEKKQKKLFWFICMILIAVSFIFGGPTMALNYWPLGFIDYLGMICVSMCILKLYYRFYKGESRIAEKISYIGRCSLWGICVHTVEMRVAWWFLVKGAVVKILPWMNHVLIDMVMEYAIDLTITILGIIIIDHIIKRIKRYKAQKRRRAIS